MEQAPPTHDGEFFAPVYNRSTPFSGNRQSRELH
jgi:hypothetical protein